MRDWNASILFFLQLTRTFNLAFGKPVGFKNVIASTIQSHMTRFTLLFLLHLTQISGLIGHFSCWKWQFGKFTCKTS